MTRRVEYLKEQMEQIRDEGVFLERAELLLQAEKQWRNSSNGTKYAQCFAYLLDHLTIVIKPHELIVGSIKEDILTDEQEQEYAQLCKHHNFKSTEIYSMDPLGLIEISDDDDRFAPAWFNSYGHCIPDWKHILAVGFPGIRREIEERKTDTSLGTEQEEFLENALVTIDAVIRYIRRYADLAGQMAESADEADRERLLEIQRICCRLSEGRAETFADALQCCWFGMLILQTVCGARDYALGRMDQYLFPFYQKDIAAGTISEKDALELVECFYVKTNEVIGYAWEAYHSKRILSKNSLQYIMLGGIDQNGNDLVNDVSYILLEAAYELKLKQPTINIRYHKNINSDFYKRACEIAADGYGFPAFYNDKTVIDALIHHGIPREVAVEYGMYGCNNNFLPGLEDELREVWICMPKLLEYALNSGASLLDDRVQGTATPHSGSFKTMEDVCEAFRIQLREALVKSKAKFHQTDTYIHVAKPFSFEAVLMSNCIKRAASMNAGGSAYKHANCHLVGLATVTNSLYTIDRLVFQEKKYSLSEFVSILKNDWSDEEKLRLRIRNTFPKYGNDDDTVDRFAAWTASMFVEEVEKASPAYGGRTLYPSFYSLWHHRAFGNVCAASADGRLAGEEISESQSPVYGTDTQGPTALLNSVAKLPFDLTPTGGLNVKFQPRFFRGESGYLNLAALMETYFANGGMHAQINVVSRETLEDAVVNPEKYKNLLVRVVGYSAYFVSLSPEQQQEMIDRTEL